MNESLAYYVRKISRGYQDLIPEQFANRTDERELIKKRVEAAQTGKIDHPLVEFYGVVGQGKSWLLSYVASSYWFSNGQSPPEEKPTFSAKIDFDELRTSFHAEPRFLLQFLIAQIKEQLAVAIPGLTIPNSLIDENLSPDEQADEFTRFLTTLLDHYVPVLTFDATDKADEGLLDWLEERIVYPIVRTNRAVFVFSGRLWHRWKIFEVRRRVEPIELPPLDRAKEHIEGTTELLAKLNNAESENVARHLYDYAFGHPLASRMILEGLRGLEELPAAGIDTQTLETNQNIIAEIVHTRVIEERFFDELGDHDYLKPLLWAVCILRKFNPTPLRHFAVSFIDGEHAQWPGGFYLDAIRNMQATTLVQWNSAAGGYALDSVIRKIMAKNLAMQDPGEFRRRHQEAVRLYDNWIEQFPRNAMGFLIERTFHRNWVLQQDKTRRKVGSLLYSEFDSLLSRVEKHPDVQWDLPDMAVALQEELVKDRELQEVIPKETFKKLEARAEQFHRNFRGSWD